MSSDSQRNVDVLPSITVVTGSADRSDGDGRRVRQSFHDAIRNGYIHRVQQRRRAIGVLRVGIHAALEQPLHGGGIRFLKRLKQRLGRRRFGRLQGGRKRECEQTSS